MAESRRAKPFHGDLLLVLPPFRRPLVSMENIGIEYIAAYARSQGFKVGIVNAGLHGLTLPDMLRIVTRSQYRVLGISVLHWTRTAALSIAKAAKHAHAGCHIIMGGIEAALNAERLLISHPFIDSIARGEGEVLIAELLSSDLSTDAWKSIDGLAYRDHGSVAFNASRELISCLDSLPFPSRDDIDVVRELGGPVAIGTSRGCFGNCSFCSVRTFYQLSTGHSWRGRSAASVVDEMRGLYEEHGATLFSFVDETVVGPGKKGTERLREIADLIRAAKLRISLFLTVRAEQVEADVFQELKAAGLRKVEIGIETMAQSQLSRYDKSANVLDNRRALEILDRLGIQSEVFMIPYDPDVTYDELRRNLDFYGARFGARRPCYDVAPLTLADYLYPYPGTQTSEHQSELGCLSSEKCYTPFWAKDEIMVKVQRFVHQFIRLVEPAFPMSYAGLGNLWVNSAQLPSAMYDRICEISAAFGQLLVEVTEWAYGVLSGPRAISASQQRCDLRRFVSRVIALREEVKEIMASQCQDSHRADGGPSLPATELAGYLLVLGKLRRKELISSMYQQPIDQTEWITNLVESLAEGEDQ